VEVRPVCVNASYWDNVMEPDGRGGLALRLGFRQIKAMREEEADWIAAARGNGYRGRGCLAPGGGAAAADPAAGRGGRLREVVEDYVALIRHRLSPGLDRRWLGANTLRAG
jgi:hypothetical protein